MESEPTIAVDRKNLSIRLPAIRLSLRFLIGFMALAALALAYVSMLIREAEREYLSYRKLCSLGATGDDWISFKEMVSGRPPIVQLSLPATVDIDMAMRLLPDLCNLRSLSIATGSLTGTNLQVIADLDLESLEFHGAFPGDRDIEGLHRFGRVQFLTLRSDHLSAESIARLRVLLPKTTLEIR